MATGFKPFGKNRTLVLPVPESAMTADEYRRVYGIELTDLGYYDMVLMKDGETMIPILKNDKDNSILYSADRAFSYASGIEEVTGSLVGKVLDDGIPTASIGTLKVDILDSDEDEISANKPVVETMEGYSATIPTQVGYTKEKVYYGAVKNGNKLTFVFAINLTKTSDAQSAGCRLAEVTIPSAIGSRLYPSLVGAYEFLDNKRLPAFTSAWSSVEGSAYVQKNSNTSISVSFDTTNFIENSKYYVRYEVTFLLSDDIAQ